MKLIEIRFFEQEYHHRKKVYMISETRKETSTEASLNFLKLKVCLNSVSLDSSIFVTNSDVTFRVSTTSRRIKTKNLKRNLESKR